MIVVLADDFSGAVELAGIGHRYGLKVEIQNELNADSRLEMIVINTNSRSMSEIKAVEVTEELCFALIKSAAPIKVFKKVDSVMRGHVVAELDVLQFHFEYDRILLIPANPSRGRIIESGKYLVDGVPLSDSVFASDPIYPALYTHIEDIINASDAIFDYNHVEAYAQLPTEGLITGDVTNTVDIANYVKQLGEFDLCAGAADCFESFLEANGHEEQQVEHEEMSFDFDSILTINGSTVKLEDEQEISKAGIFQSTLSSERYGNTFLVENMDRVMWHADVLDHLKREKRAYVSIAHPIKQEKKLSELFMIYLSELGRAVVHGMNGGNILLGLTGGATAMAVMNGLNIKTLKVKAELFPGVVLVHDAADASKLFLVKPGSYAWPKIFLDHFTSKS